MSEEEYKAQILAALERFPQLTERQKQCTVELYTRYRRQKAEGKTIEWEKVKALPAERLGRYEDLPEPSPAEVSAALRKVAVLKLNGGLGTSMGCAGPKSLLNVRDGRTFLDFSLDQLAAINSAHDADVPLVLMNSFNTEAATRAHLAARTAAAEKSGKKEPRVLCFSQFELPRMDAATGLPVTFDGPAALYPPGHGFVYECLLASGVVDKLIASGVEWLFLSNADNLGAVLDPKIAAHVVSTQGLEFLSEQTPKTPADVKGGVLIEYEGQIHLLETAQVPSGHEADFRSREVFPFFHINNLWINLAALRTHGAPALDLIINPKTVNDVHVIQLEVAAGAAISHFSAAGLVVPRNRFRPVKKVGDLLLLQSDCFSVDSNAQLVQTVETLPLVVLNCTVADYAQMFAAGIPGFRDAKEVIIEGKVEGQTGAARFRGTLHVQPGETLHIDAGGVYGKE